MTTDRRTLSIHRSAASGRSSPARAARLDLLDLPVDVLSQIAQCLPLAEQIRFLSLHPTLLALCRTSLSPIPPSVRAALKSPDPYPRLLARLPTLSLFLPDDSGQLFIDLLVRARPRWILETLEYGRWNESIWREAFERRFLRSWRRFKGQDDSWRAIYLRLLSRLEHRATGCSHDENWTRFVTLHRNGSASLNRIYSRNFDPYDIFDEFKHQNNFAGQSTHVRVIMHLQDVRVLAIGVLFAQSSIFVNPNAHLVCHPPLLRHLATRHQEDDHVSHSGNVAARDIPARTPMASVSPSANSNEVYFPLVRSISPSGPANTTYGLGEAGSSQQLAISPSSPGLLSTFARVLPGRTRRLSTVGAEPEDRGLFRTRSRDPDALDEGRRRTWSFGRARHGSSSSITGAMPSAAVEGATNEPRITQPLTPAMPTLSELVVDKTVAPPTPPRTRTPSPLLQTRKRLPYSPLVRPVPHRAFADYPNYTPSGIDTDANDKPLRADRRMQHDEVEDDGLAGVWSQPDSSWPEEIKMAEWDDVAKCRRRWVGPMILVAQIHPCDRDSALPIGANGRLEGDDPDLGHHGMYASLGYEDLEDLFPWVQLKNAGTEGVSRRSGLGFE